MKLLTCIGFVILLSIITLAGGKPIEAKAPIRPLEDYSVHELIGHFSKKYQVSEKEMHFVIKCESGYKESIIGDNGTSFGLVQIHLPAHPYVTKAQAVDKVFAVEFLAKNLSLGNGRWWTCYRMIYS